MHERGEIQTEIITGIKKCTSNIRLLLSNLLYLQVAHKNRSFYRQLRTDLHDLSTDGLYLQQSLLNEGANAMQKLSGINLLIANFCKRVFEMVFALTISTCSLVSINNKHIAYFSGNHLPTTWQHLAIFHNNF